MPPQQQIAQLEGSDRPAAVAIAHLRGVLRTPLSASGIVGLTEQMLAVLRDKDLRIEFRSDLLLVLPTGGDEREGASLPLKQSVARAVLARIAFLCNERAPGSVTPYGGEGDIVVGEGRPAATVHVKFVNTAAEQRLDVT